MSPDLEDPTDEADESGAVSEAGSEPTDGADESDGEETPAISGEERASVPDLGSVADKVEESAGAGSDEGSSSSSDDEADEAADREEPSEMLANSFGDLYVDSLAAVLGAIVEEHGDQENPDMDAEAIEDLASGAPFHLNEHVDGLAEEMGAESDLSPQQAVVISTCAIVALVLIKETDVANSAISTISEQLNTGDLE